MLNLDFSIWFNDFIYSIQEPYRFIIIFSLFLGTILFILLLLLINSRIESRNAMKEKILAEIKRKKTENPNCHILYRNKVY